MTTTETSERPDRRPRSSRATTVLAVAALIGALYLLSDLMVPVTFAVLIYLLLLQPVRWFARRGIPSSVSAGVLIIATASILVGAAVTLMSPADRWLAEAPRTLRDLQRELSAEQGSIATIKELAHEVDELTKPDAEPGASEVVVTGPGAVELLLGGLPHVIAFVGITVFLSFFLLASGDSLVRRMTRCGRTYSERRRIVSITRHIQADLSRYLLTITGINAALGITVAIALHLLGVPNPLLWGAMVYFLNFAPYIGALTSGAILTFVGMMTFGSLSEALVVPGVFLALTILEGQLITPAVLGQRMSMNPIVVFLTVVFWGWLWGIFGALMAVPILTCFKVVCEHVPRLRPVGIFLRRDDTRDVNAARLRPANHSAPLASAGR